MLKPLSNVNSESVSEVFRASQAPAASRIVPRCNTHNAVPTIRLVICVLEANVCHAVQRNARLRHCSGHLPMGLSHPGRTVSAVSRLRLRQSRVRFDGGGLRRLSGFLRDPPAGRAMGRTLRHAALALRLETPFEESLSPGSVRQAFTIVRGYVRGSSMPSTCATTCSNCFPSQRQLG